MKHILIVAGAALICAASAAAQQQAPLPDCSAPEHRVFDFWVGEWLVYPAGQDVLAGRSTIALEDKGCVITETWRSARADYTGRSVNLFDRATGKWEQFWVDSTGDVTHFIGGPHENGMRLVAEDDVSPQTPTPHFNRMTFTANADGTIRQHGETSPDGQSWTTAYDFIYRRGQ